MLGAIIGDMVGSPYEFHPWQGAAEAFPLFSPCSRFTDDTVMTVAVARGLMQAYGQEQACREACIDAMLEYGRAYSRAGYDQRFRYESKKRRKRDFLSWYSDRYFKKLFGLGG